MQSNSQRYLPYAVALAAVPVGYVATLLVTEQSLLAVSMAAMGALIACVILSGRATAPLAQVAGLLTRFQQSKEALTQLDDLLKKPVERPVDKHFISLPNISGRVEFRDVVFHYPGQTVPALNHLNFTIEPG